MPDCRRSICLALLLFLFGTGPAIAQQAQIAGYQLVSQRHVVKATFLFTYRAVLVSGTTPLAGAAATVASLSPDLTIVDATLTFGAVAAGGSVTSADTFSFTMERRDHLEWQPLLSWTVAGASANRPPVASAGPDQTVPGIGSMVTLDGSGSSDPDGDALAYQWQFTLVPDGSTAVLDASTTPAATFVADTKGAYAVQLLVLDGLSASAADSVTITVGNTAPVAATAGDLFTFVGQSPQVDGTPSSDADGDPLTYAWSFVSIPAGSATALSGATEAAPTFLADTPGTYVLQLVVHDGTSASAPATVTVITQNSPPLADAGPAQTAPVGAIVTLNGSGSSDVDGDALTYSWSFDSTPDGSLAALTDAASVTPAFTIDRAGTYVVRLIVHDGAADSAVATVIVSTVNSAPVANAGADQTAPVSTTVTLNGGASTDVDGDALTYSWSLAAVPDGSAAALSDPAAVSPTLTIDRAGSYVIELMVSDGLLWSAPDTVLITTSNTTPVAHAGADQSVFVTDTVTLDGSGSTDVDGHLLTYVWALTSVPAGSAAALSSPGALMPTFVVDVFGTYVAQLTVHDGTTMSVADTVTITTLNSPPIAAAGPDQSIVAGQTIWLDGNGSSDVDGNPLTFAWSLTAQPDGSAATLENATMPLAWFTAATPGTYVAQLIVHDASVSSAPDTVTITTTNLAPVAHAGSDQLSVPVGSVVQLDGNQSADADGHLLTFAWSLVSTPQGSTAVLAAPTSATPAFTADLPGDYVAQLIVTDGYVSSAPSTVLIRTADRFPIADAGADQTVTVGETVLLDGTGSYDPDGGAVTHAWQVMAAPAGSMASLADATGPHPTLVPDVAGLYLIELTVTGGLGATATDLVVVTAQAVGHLDLMPAGLTFPLTDVGQQSAAQTVTVTNNGGPALTFASATATGDFGLSANTCVALAPSETCTIDVFFAPTAGGAAAGTLAVSFQSSEAAVFAGAVSLAGAGNPSTIVTVVATDADASESGDPGSFTITRTGDTTSALVVTVQKTGTAAHGTDYAGFIGPTIPAGQPSTTIVVTPLTDALVEGPETVTLILIDDAEYNVGAEAQATVTIADDVTLPVVTITASDPNATEMGLDLGAFTITRTGSTALSLTVNVSRLGSASSGVDYQALSSAPAIPAGQSSLVIAVTPTNDALVEGPETVEVALTAGAGYAIGTPATATITIGDNPIPVITISATDASASEVGLEPGTFTITRVGDLTFPLTIEPVVRTGTAVSGVDYLSIGANTQFAAGQATVTKTVTPRNDALVEGPETVILTLVDGAQYDLGVPSTATVTISDNPVPIVTIEAADPSASESPLDTGTFVITRVGDTALALPVTLTRSPGATAGVDYTNFSTSVSIPAGSSTATITVTPINDAGIEGEEMVTLTVNDGANYDVGTPASATVTILSDD